MNKQEFISSLRKALCGLPQEDAERSAEFYDEMIDDRMEDGLTEEEVIAELGSVEEISAQMLSDIPLAKLVKAKVKSNRALKVWEIVLLVLGSPVWLPLLLSAVIILLSVYIVIWSVIISLYAVDISFAFSGIASIVTAFIYLYISGNVVGSLLYFGAGLICTGLAIILLLGFNQATKKILLLSKKTLIGIKSLFIQKGDVQ